MYKMYFSVLWTLSFVFSGAPALIYQLDTLYAGSRFFDEFDFFTDSDPTHGFVTYVSSWEASSLGLAGVTSNNQARLSVDSYSKLDPMGPGRKSVRLTSKKSWTHGLFVADISHMPGGSCGSWPAFWTVGGDWPNNGEIDIIEGVNSQRANSMALHTSANCQMSPTQQLGTIQNTNCDGTTNNNAGCGVHSTSSSTYGGKFNAIGGGVYAMEWTSQFIKIWFFPRNSIPRNLKSGKPDTSSWGTPQSFFKGNCDIDSHFKSHNIVFDTTFCGDWASNVWSTDATCSRLASTCNEYVANNPMAFKDAYWAINSVKVYTSTADDIDGTPSEVFQANTDATASTELAAEAPAPPIANSGQDNTQLQNNVQTKGVAQDLSPELSRKAKGGSAFEPLPPMQLTRDNTQNLGEKTIDAMGPEIAVLEAASHKGRRGFVFGQDEFNIPAEATPSVFANIESEIRLGAEESTDSKDTQPEPALEFDDKFRDFVPGRKKSDDEDDDKNEKKIGKNIAKNIGKTLSLITENEDTTELPTRTNLRNEIHAVANVVSHHIVKDLHLVPSSLELSFSPRLLS